jgi:hypothetical protein
MGVAVGGIGVAVGGIGVAVGSGMNMLVNPQPRLVSARRRIRMINVGVDLIGMDAPGCKN